MARFLFKDVPSIDFPTFDQMSGAAGVYLVHLERPLAHARHYTGYADDIVRRLQEHMECKGSRLLCAAVNRGIPFEVVKIWPGQGRSLERQIKNSKAATMLCPICGPSYRVRSRERMRRLRKKVGRSC